MQHLSWVGNDGLEDLSGGRREDNRDYSILDVVNQIFEVFFGELNVVNNLPLIVVLQRDSPMWGLKNTKEKIHEYGSLDQLGSFSIIIGHVFPANFQHYFHQPAPTPRTYTDINKSEPWVSTRG
jgi:hypothetical protein